MKTLSRTLLVLALLTLTAAPAFAGGAISNTWHEHNPSYTEQPVFACLGDELGAISEVVDMTVSSDSVTHTTVTPSGTVTYVFNETGSFTGIGRDTGNRYEGHFTWHIHYSMRVGEVVIFHFPYVWKNIDTGQMQFDGRGTHVTVNANGEVTAEWDEWEPRSCVR